jgi:hypothetical protein
LCEKEEGKQTFYFGVWAFKALRAVKGQGTRE